MGTRRWATIAASEADELYLGLLLSPGGEDVDDPVDRLGGVVGVQGGEHQVAGLGHGEGDLDRLDVTHLTDQENVGVLPQGRAECPVERGAVKPDLPLADGRQLVVMHILDRVLNREDVACTRLVDAVDDGSQRGRLSRAGRPGDQNESAGQIGQPFGHWRQVEFAEARNPGRDHPERQGCLASLGEGAATEAGPVQPREGEVDVLLDVERLPLRWGEEGPDEGVDLVAGEHRGTFDRTELAADPDPWRRVSGQQEVGTFLVPEDLQPRRDRLDVDFDH